MWESKLKFKNVAQETNNTNNKKDWLDRRVSNFLDIVGAVGKDVRSVILTASLVLNFILFQKVFDMSDRIVEEVRKQGLPIIREEAENQFKDTKDRIDTTLNQVKRKLDIDQNENSN